jgi:hypothetical protein
VRRLPVPPRDDAKAVTPEQKARIKHLLSFRVVVDSLLYVIGVPKKFADIDLLKSEKFCGLYGVPKRIVINHNPKDDCGGQVAVYCHYSSVVETALAQKVSLIANFD